MSLLSLISQIDFNYSVINPLVGVTVIIGFIIVVWRIAVNYQKQESATALIDSKVIALDKKVEKLFNTAELQNKELEKFFADALNKDKLEWKEEVKQALFDVNSRFADIQSQLSSIRSQLKDVDNRVTIVDTIVKGHTQGMKALHKRINKNIDFFTNWTQRVENRVEEAQNRLTNMISEAEKRLMGTMNMLINARNGRSSR